MGEHASSIPQLWSSSLQETRTHMQSQPRLPAGVRDNSIAEEAILMRDTWPRHASASASASSAESTQMKALIKTRPFQYIIATILVFVVSLVLLVAIQPPFTLSSENDERDVHTTRKFSVARASLYALGATGVGFAIASGMYVFAYRASRKVA